jgi:hypothetical protein
MAFSPIAGSDGFTRANGSVGGLFADNGTDYIQASLGDSLQFAPINGSTFGLSSVQLAGYSSVVPDFAITFTGLHPDGSSVSQTFSGSGLTFQTFSFNSQFTDLTKVEINNPVWSMDNLVIVPAPEPSSLALALFGICGLFVITFASRLSRR